MIDSMYYKKIFILLISFLFIACLSKKSQIPIKSVNIEKTPTLNTIKESLIENCHAKAKRDTNNSIFLELNESVLKIDLGYKNDFQLDSQLLVQTVKNKLFCIAPILIKQNALTIQITGHANDNNDTSKDQYLSDNRAITVAEELFNLGIRDEIFAKGCSGKKLKNAKVEIFVYEDKSKLKDQCK